jgi:hypothetical protein
LYDFLDSYYGGKGYKLLQRFNPKTKKYMKYPVTVIEVPMDRHRDPQSILGKLDPTKKEERIG